MIPVQDYSDWNIYDGASEGSGRSEKIWLISDDGNIGLFKAIPHRKVGAILPEVI